MVIGGHLISVAEIISMVGIISVAVQGGSSPYDGPYLYSNIGQENSKLVLSRV